jgi:hypothetical protein
LICSFDCHMRLLKVLIAGCVLLLIGAARVEQTRTLSSIFEENRGQASPDSRFLTRGAGYTLAFTAQGTRVALKHAGGTISFSTNFVAANPSPALRGEDEQESKVHYFRPGKSLTNIPTYARVRYQALYPSVDLLYYGKQRELEYDFIVHPGGKPENIALRFDGTERVTIDSRGDLLVRVNEASVVQRKPVAYQEYRGLRKSIDARYRLVDRNTVAFELGSYDPRAILVIDPVLAYSTFLGGNGDDDARAIATDSTGSVYITGSTSSTNFPTVTPIQAVPGNQNPDVTTGDAFVTKLNASGTAILFSTYLGGADDDISNAIAVDSAGNVLIAGVTASSAFPTTGGAVRRTCSVAANGSCLDAFVAKLNATGSTLIYSTYLGGTGDDEARGIAVDSVGNAYVTGKTASANFPVTGGAFSTDGTSGGFVTKLTPAGAVVYSTYLGAGSGAAEPNGIAVDSSGNAYIAGATPSTTANGTDVFITKLNPSGTGVIYSQFLRGTKDDAAAGVAVDGSGNAYVTGKTFSINFPTTSGVIQPVYAGGPLFRSADAAVTWIPSSTGIARGSFYALAVSPSSPSVIYAGADDENAGDVFKSADGGNTWVAVSAGLTDARVHALAVDPTTPSTVYAGSRSAGVFKSADGGGTWSATALKAAFVTALAVDPATPSTVYAGTDSSGFYKSTDGGTTWAIASDALSASSIHSIVINPSAPANLYAATSTGVYKSTDGGKTWISANSGIFDENVNAIAINPRNPSLLFAATNSFGIFRSLNAGSFWLASNSGIPSSTAGVPVSALAIDPNSGAVYAAIGQSNVSRIYKSSDGISWSPAGLASSRVSSIVVNQNAILAASAGGSEAFVAKWDASGTLVYSTYLGGYRNDAANAIAVDTNGDAAIGGTTSSMNFPTANAIQATFSGGTDLVTDAFAAKLNPSGTALLWATYLGGSSDDSAKGIAMDSAGNVYVAGQTGSADFPAVAAISANRPELLNAFVAKVSDSSSSAFAFASRGGISISSGGGSVNVTAGYAMVQPNATSVTPSGMAIFGFRQKNVLVSEAAVPASSLISSGRIYAEVSASVNTGIAMANPNGQQVTVAFKFTDATGTDFGQGSTTIPPSGQIAQFLNQAPFNSGASLAGTFTFTASLPISVVALRGVTNERSEFLITTLPVADLSVAPGSDPILFPHFADGGGWTTQILLVNTTENTMSGAIQFCVQAGCPPPDTPAITNVYTLQPRSSFQFRTAGSTATATAGSVRVVPTSGMMAPSGVAVFSFKSGGVTVSTAGVPAAATSSAVRLYAELSGTPGQIGSIQTGVAIANPGASTASVVFELSSLSGTSTGLTGSINVPATGQTAIFLNQIPGFAALPNPFQGVLRVSTASSAGISVTGIRGRYNERGDFLVTTTQPADESHPPAGTQFFPHFADGGGYTTQFILFNGGPDQASSGSLRFFGQAGQPISFALR